MEKQEFITVLSEALQGEVPSDVIRENLDYYRRYIAEETAKGRMEHEVLEELGDPRLIAKTIIDACPESAENLREEGYEGTRYSETNIDREYTGRGSYEDRARAHWHMIDLSKWYWKLAGILLVLVVLWVVFSIIGGIFSLLIRFAWPLFILWMIYILIRNSKRR